MSLIATARNLEMVERLSSSSTDGFGIRRGWLWWFLIMSAVRAEAGLAETTILPPGSADSEGGRLSGILAYPVHVQQVYHRSLLPPGPIRIEALRFRRDRLVDPVSDVQAQIEVHLSTTEKEPDALELDMTLNVGTNDLLVFEGALAADSSGSGPAEGPNPFDIEIPFMTSFLYDPADGNLLVEARTSIGTGVVYVDAVNDTGDLASRVFATSAGSTGLALADSQADVIELVYQRVLARPEITSPPEDVSVGEGGEATFSVTAGGTEPLFYQWYWDGNPLEQGTNAVLMLGGVTAEDAGEYWVVVSNAVDIVTSAPATLRILFQPSITVQPQGGSAAVGSSATFTVTALGTAPLIYQWFHEGEALDGATASTLVLGAVDVDDAGEYTVEVSNSEGSVMSAPAPLVLVSDEFGLVPGWSATGFTLTVAAAAGADYAVEWSADLETWNPLATVLNAASTWQIPDPDSLGQARRFYRVKRF